MAELKSRCSITIILQSELEQYFKNEWGESAVRAMNAFSDYIRALNLDGEVYSI